MYETQWGAVREDIKKLEELRACLKGDDTNIKIGALEARMSEPGFWDNADTAQKVVQELKALKGIVSAPAALKTELEDLEVLIEMAAEEDDASHEEEIREQQEALQERLARLD